jgi:hypothetical protein
MVYHHVFFKRADKLPVNNAMSKQPIPSEINLDIPFPIFTPDRATTALDATILGNIELRIGK